MQLFAYPRTHLQVFVSQERKSCVYVWGIPAHPQMPRSDIPAWCAELVAQRQYHRFRELLGTFVVLVDDPLEHQMTFVSDILGIRPMFIGQRDGQIVFGSDVWALQQAGATSGECDYPAVSSWLAYGYNCTGGSLFADLRRLPPGAAVVIKDGRARDIPYAAIDINPRLHTPDEAHDHIHEIVSSTTRALVADHPRFTVALSGGFDSRYLLALCLSVGAPLERIINVKFTEEEGEVAQRVAEILGVPVETLPVDTSVWDLYDEAHHFMADGFPISKFVTHCVAQRYPNIPMVNGFMGDSLVRGSNDKCEGKYEQDWSGDLADVLQKKHFAISLDLFRSSIAKQIQVGSRAPMEEAVRQGSGKVFGWADLYIRQRRYISNNFLQHLGLAEALLPFYSWGLMSYKMGHDDHGFSKDMYHRIFKNRFPALAAVPHASDLKHNGAAVKRARCTTQWARELLGPLCKKNWLDLLAKERCIPLVMMGASPLPPLNRRLAHIAEDTLLTVRRLYLLERRLKEAHVDFDWSQV